MFLLIIFALLIKLFFLSIKHSQLEFKVQVLAEEHAILKKKLEDALPAPGGKDDSKKDGEDHAA